MWFLARTIIICGTISMAMGTRCAQAQEAIDSGYSVQVIKEPSSVTKRQPISRRPLPNHATKPAPSVKGETSTGGQFTVKIEKVPNKTHYAPYGSSDTKISHATPDIHPAMVEPEAKPAALTGKVQEEDAVAAAGGSDNDHIQTVAVVPANVYRGTGKASNELLSAAALLQDYETKTVSPRAYQSFVHANHKLPPLKSSAVVVFKGKWDKAEHLLDESGIPYSCASSGKLQQQLAQAVVAIIDCPGDLDERMFPAIQQFVRRGGYLISTDWAIDGSIARTFPGYLVWKGAYSRPQTLDAVEVMPSDPLLAGTGSGVVPWRLDDKCEIVEIGGAGSVDVLVRSRTLAHQDPNGLGILAATFPFGSGKVLHLVGHFDNNTGLSFNEQVRDPSPSIKISLRQAVALNFICEALEHLDQTDASHSSTRAGLNQE